MPSSSGTAGQLIRPSGCKTSMTGSECRTPISKSSVSCAGVTFRTPVPNFGPIDGHNIAQMIQTLEIVKTLKGPRVVHVITEKGKGFPLPQPDTEKYHARAPYDPVTGELRPVKAGPPQWTAVFGEALAQLAGEYPKLVAITAAMPSGTGTGLTAWRR